MKSYFSSIMFQRKTSSLAFIYIYIYIDLFILRYQCWPGSKNLQQACADTGCSLKDLPAAIDNKDGLKNKERESGKSVLGAHFNYIYIYIYILKKNKNWSHLDDKFISILLWVLIWINNTKSNWTSSDLMDKIITVRIILSIRSEEVVNFWCYWFISILVTGWK